MADSSETCDFVEAHISFEVEHDLLIGDQNFPKILSINKGFLLHHRPDI